MRVFCRSDSEHCDFYDYDFLDLCVCLVTQSYLTLCDPMDCSSPGSSVYGISQARILELPVPSPADLPDPGIEPMSLASPALAGRFFTTKPPGKPFLDVPSGTSMD